MIRIADITVPAGRRAVDMGVVEGLAESIERVGLLNPITVTPDLVLIAGLHRLRAFERLGREEIEVRTLDLDEVDRELAELDENLQRNHGTEIERRKWLQRQKELWEARFPETVNGATGKGRPKTDEPPESKVPQVAEANEPHPIDFVFTSDPEPPERFTARAARNLGTSESTVQRHIASAKKLDDEAADGLVSIAHDTKAAPEIREAARKAANDPKQIAHLAKQTPEKQREVVDKIAKGEAATVKQATRSARITNDAYYTPDALAQVLVGLLPDVRGDVLEPHVGGGSFARALKALDGVRVLGHDIDFDAPGAVVCDLFEQLDFLEETAHFDWVIGNPPYDRAEEHVRHALERAPRVAFLLRLGFLESRERVPFWEQHPCRKVWVLAERPSFAFQGTDQTAYGWFFWDRDHDGPTELEVVSWR